MTTPKDQPLKSTNLTPNNRLGIGLMLATVFVFSVQDAITRHLATDYNVLMVVMIRYWFFAAFVVAIALRSKGGIRAIAQTSQLKLQIFRGVLLGVEVAVMAAAFVALGLVQSHAIFAAFPLIVAALSGPVLGEKVGWRRWMAISAGFIGLLVILRPEGDVMQPASLIALCAAAMFSLYSLLTRYVARRDTAMTSFFWTGVAGAVTMTIIGVGYWEPMSGTDWGWMIMLSISGIIGHGLLIRCYAVAEASAVQPFAYFQLVFASTIGMIIFGETLKWNVAIGAAIIVSAGVFTILRAGRKRNTP